MARPSRERTSSGVSETLSHPATYPIEIFEMELLEDGVSAFQLIPPHSPQVWQQLVPLLGTQPVRFAGLRQEISRGPQAFLPPGPRRGPHS